MLFFYITLTFLTFSFTKAAQADGYCDNVQSVCQQAVNWTCPTGTTLDATGCKDTTQPECTLRTWKCVTPSKPCMVSYMNTCQPTATCPQGQIPTIDCRQYDSNPSGCEGATGTFSCKTVSNICEWKGAASCEPVNVCVLPNVMSVTLMNKCHTANGNQTLCKSFTISDLNGQARCVTPDDWYCLPSGGWQADQCAPCFNNPATSRYKNCKDVVRISRAMCAECNINTGVQPQKIFCDLDGTPTSRQTGKIFTAIGCIPFIGNLTISSFFLRWGIGIGIGIAFVLMVIAGFMVITSAGDPRKLQAGKELLTAAISGLIILIFSAFILRIIGVNILNIPGLNIP